MQKYTQYQGFFLQQIYKDFKQKYSYPLFFPGFFFFDNI